MGKIIGIDLGTTNSAVAIYENDRAEVFTNLLGQRTTPSVVALKKTRDKKTKLESLEWVVGADAKRQAAMNPLNTLYGVKRLIGRKFDDPEVQKMGKLASYKIIPNPNGNGDAWVEVNGEAMAPAEISAKVLMELKKAVEQQIGEEVTEAVITVPAYFNDDQRKATVNAGRIAGLNVKRIINEPTAAALAYGMNDKKGGNIAVYDLGGGTFDVSILNIDKDDGTVVMVKATNGDTFLGGENFDERITEFLVGELNKEHGTDIDVHDEASKKQHAAAIQRLREAAEKAKIELSIQEVTTVNIPFLMQTEDGETVNFELNITRKELENLLRDLVEKTVEPCKKALADAGLTAADLDEVILVGGQTRMPLVIETVKGFFGKEPRRDVNPDEIVAMGASVQGAVIQGKVEDVLLVDVIPLSLGIRVAGDVMNVLVPRNTPIPFTFETPDDDCFSTAKDMQTNVEIQIFQGERPQASDNKLLGKFTLDGIPPAKKGVPQIALKLEIDENGVMSVSARDVKTGRAQKITVKANGGLTEDEIDAMLKTAEANQERDRTFRETLVAAANADEALRDAENDTQQEYFQKAPEKLVKEFTDAVSELTTARKSNDLAAMVEKTQKLSDVRIAIGEAFNESANSKTPANDDAPAAEAPAAAAKAAKPQGPNAA